jgi:hypothetical protein
MNWPVGIFALLQTFSYLGIKQVFLDRKILCIILSVCISSSMLMKTEILRLFWYSGIERS